MRTHFECEETKLISKVESGVLSISFIGENESILGKGTGFVSKKLLLTNSHIAAKASNELVKRVLIQQDHYSDVSKKSHYINMSASDFSNAIISGSDPNNFDYSILNIPCINNWGVFNFELTSHNKISKGHEVFFLGYPLGHMNLCAHFGRISSYFSSGSRQQTNVIQIDASVNNSNSGGPLIDKTTGNVIGIITRKATGLTTVLSELEKILNHNISVLSNLSGGIITGGINPTDGIIASQRQLQMIIKEIERSANVGIGYAFSCDHILEDALYADA